MTDAKAARSKLWGQIGLFRMDIAESLDAYRDAIVAATKAEYEAKMAWTEWRWLGFAGHFICADSCLFRLCTDVGDYRISSVGAMRSNRKVREIVGAKDGEFEDVGPDRKYESFVFRLGDGICSCGCGEREIANFSEIDSLAANDAKTARENHMTLCRQYDAARTPSPETP